MGSGADFWSKKGLADMAPASVRELAIHVRRLLDASVSMGFGVRYSPAPTAPAGLFSARSNNRRRIYRGVKEIGKPTVAGTTPRQEGEDGCWQEIMKSILATSLVLLILTTPGYGTDAERDSKHFDWQTIENDWHFEDTDGDGFSDGDEAVAGTNPNDETSAFLLHIGWTNGNPTASFNTLQTSDPDNPDLDRYYTLSVQTNLRAESWQVLPGFSNILGRGQTVQHVTGISAGRFYQGTVKLLDTGPSATSRVFDVSYAPPPAGDPAMAELDIYYVADGHPKNLMVFVHGGGWTSGDKSNLVSTPALVSWFLDRNYVVAAPNFRVATFPNITPAVTYADMATDVAFSLGWLSEHAGDYGVVSSSVLLVGYSSGAHIVALLSTDDSYLRSAGLNLGMLAGTISLDVHAYDIPLALQLMDGSDLESNIPLIKHLFGNTEAEQLSGSPVTYVSNPAVPPALVISAEPSSDPASHGYISARASQNYVEQLTNANHQATWVHFDGETHLSLVFDFGTAGDGPTEAVESFLSEISGE